MTTGDAPVTRIPNGYRGEPVVFICDNRHAFDLYGKACLHGFHEFCEADYCECECHAE